MDTIKIDYNAIIPTFNNPTKDGYIFAGWDIEIPATMPSNDLTIKALWKPTIKVEYNVNSDKEGSDIWLTYPKTAQLVGKLLYDNNLDLSRVKGHHFFDGKDCPQPLLENNMEIWKEFIEQVRYAKQLLSLNSDSRYTITMQKVTNGNYISNYGRLTNQPALSSVITYKGIITDTQRSTTEEITLSSVIEGTYLNK